MKIQPHVDPDLNQEALHHPQVADMWEEHCCKIFLVLKVDERYVHIARIMNDPMHPGYQIWNFDAVERLTRARFVKALTYDSPEMQGKCWADVHRNHWSGKELPPEKEWRYNTARKIGASQRVYKAPLIDLISMPPHETFASSNCAHWSLEPIEIYDICDVDGPWRFEGCFMAIHLRNRSTQSEDVLYWQIVPKKHTKPFVSRFGRLARPEAPAKVVECLNLQAKRHATAFDTFSKVEVFRIKKNWRGDLVEVKAKPILLPRTLWQAVLVHRDETFCV